MTNSVQYVMHVILPRKSNLPGQDHNERKSIHHQKGSKMMFHWLLKLDKRTTWMLVALLLEKETSLICSQDIGFFF